MLRSIVLLHACVLFSLPALAEGMKVEPGKWEFTNVSKNPMGVQPKTEQSIECIREDEITPELFMKDSQGCSFSDVESSATSMKFKMSCAAPGGEMGGDASFTSTGKTATGKMVMTMDFNGQKMTFEQSWDGKHVGACD